MDSNFTENIKLTWDVEDVASKVATLQSQFAALSDTVSGLQGAMQAVAVGVSGAFNATNATLERTLSIIQEINQQGGISGNASILPSGTVREDIGGGVTAYTQRSYRAGSRYIDAQEAERRIMEQRSQSLGPDEGIGGGALDFVGQQDFAGGIRGYGTPSGFIQYRDAATGRIIGQEAAQQRIAAAVEQQRQSEEAARAQQEAQYRASTMADLDMAAARGGSAMYTPAEAPQINAQNWALSKGADEQVLGYKYQSVNGVEDTSHLREVITSRIQQVQADIENQLPAGYIEDKIARRFTSGGDLESILTKSQRFGTDEEGNAYKVGPQTIRTESPNPALSLDEMTQQRELAEIGANFRAEVSKATAALPKPGQLSATELQASQALGGIYGENQFDIEMYQRQARLDAASQAADQAKISSLDWRNDPSLMRLVGESEVPVQPNAEDALIAQQQAYNASMQANPWELNYARGLRAAAEAGIPREAGDNYAEVVGNATTMFGARPNLDAKALKEIDDAAKSAAASTGGFVDVFGKIGDKAGEFASGLATMATRLFEIQIVMGGVRAASELVNQAFADMVSFQDALARTSIVTGGQMNGTQVLAQTLSDAAVGIGPQQSEQGTLMAAQYANPRAQQAAAQLQLLLGGQQDYASTVQDVAQTMDRTNGAFDNTTRLLDLVATMYKTAHLSAAEYYKTIQDAQGVSTNLNQTLEQSSIMLANYEAATGRSADSAAAYYEKLLKRTENPRTAGVLAGEFGITGATPDERLKEAAALYEKLVAQGPSAREELSRLSLALSVSGGVQSGTDLQLLGDAMKALNDITAKTTTTTGQWGQTSSLMMDTIGQKWKDLTASAAAYWNVVANTGAGKGVGDWAGGVMTGAQQGLQGQADQLAGADALSKLSDNAKVAALESYIASNPPGNVLAGLKGNRAAELQYVNEAAKGNEIGNFGAFATLSRATGRVDLTATSEAAYFNEWYTQHGRDQTPSELSFTNNPLGASGGGVAGTAYAPTPMPFGGLRDIPRGVDPAGIQAAADAADKQLTATAKANNIAYDPSTQSYLLFDQINKSFTTVTTTADALSIALKDAAANLKDFAGFKDLPKGMTVDQLQSSANIWAGRIRAAEPGQEFKDVRTDFWDPVTQTFKSVIAPTEALRLAIEENTKKLNQLSGTFNVPAGAQVLVTFDALKAGFTPNTGSVPTAPGGGDLYGPKFESGVNQFDQAVSMFSNIVERAMYLGHPVPGGGPGTISPFSSLGSQMRAEEMGGGTGYGILDTRGGGGSMVINTRNEIMLDGHVIASALQTKVYQSSVNARRVTAGGNNGVVMVG